MKHIEYCNGQEELLTYVAPLWTKLNEHHKALSKHFSEKYSKFTFKERKKSFEEIVTTGMLNVELVRDVKPDAVSYKGDSIDKGEAVYIGYCISSINKDLLGQIESIYIEPEYRKLGIGDTLMKNALGWMEENGVKTKRIGVAAGNENAFGFYARYGFYPKVTMLEQSFPLGK